MEITNKTVVTEKLIKSYLNYYFIKSTLKIFIVSGVMLLLGVVNVIIDPKNSTFALVVISLSLIIPAIVCGLEFLMRKQGLKRYKTLDNPVYFYTFNEKEIIISTIKNEIGTEHKVSCAGYYKITERKDALYLYEFKNSTPYIIDKSDFSEENLYILRKSLNIK